MVTGGVLAVRGQQGRDLDASQSAVVAGPGGGIADVVRPVGGGPSQGQEEKTYGLTRQGGTLVRLHGRG